MSTSPDKEAVISYWSTYADRCYQQYLRDIAQQNAFMYWVGGAYLTLIGAAGYSGIIVKEGETNNLFQLQNIIALQLAMLAAALYFLRKDLYASINLTVAKSIEAILCDHQCIDTCKHTNKFPRFLDCSDKMLEGVKFIALSKSVNWAARILVFILYVTLTTYPLFSEKAPGYGGNTPTLGILFVVMFISIMLIMCGGFLALKYVACFKISHYLKPLKEALDHQSSATNPDQGDSEIVCTD